MICRYDKITTSRKKGQQLKEFSLTIENADSMAFLGTNGSGKSLIGALLTNALEIESGEFEAPSNVSLVSFERINEIIEEDWIEADITEATFLNPGLTCRDLIIEECGHDNNIEEQLKRFSLYEKKDTAIRHLSTGEIAKTLLIGALLAKPDLIILDEPFDGLDVHSREVVAEAIDQLIEDGISLIVILNRIEEIPETIKRIALMDHTSIIHSGPRNTVLASEPFQHLFSLHKSLPETLPGEQRIGKPSTDGLGRLVKMKDVTVAYGEKPVLNAINWNLYPSVHWKISGPNGCGKSTLLQLISGDHSQAYANDITLFGTKRGSGETVWDIKREVGIVSTLLQRDYRVPGNILSAVLSGFHDSIGLYSAPTSQEEAEARKWLRVINMDHKRNLPFRRLSYGEQRMILIVRAMVKRPAILILDEPCLGLDPLNRELVLHLVDHIAKTGSTTVLYVTHHDEDVIPSIQESMRFVPAKTGGFTLELSTEQNEVEPHRCPLCNEPNHCKANSDEPCWCSTVTIPQELRDRIPASYKGKACICRKCVESYLEEQKSGVKE